MTQIITNLKSRSAAIAAGDKTYQADKPCKRGHEPVRYTASRVCVACHRVDNRAAVEAGAWKGRSLPFDRKVRELVASTSKAKLLDAMTTLRNLANNPKTGLMVPRAEFELIGKILEIIAGRAGSK